MSVLFAVATGIMFGMGIYQLLRRDLIKAAFGFYILFTAINLFLLASGAFEGVMPAYVDEQNRTLGTTSDPLVRSLDFDGHCDQLRHLHALAELHRLGVAALQDGRFGRD